MKRLILFLLAAVLVATAQAPTPPTGFVQPFSMAAIGPNGNPAFARIDGAGNFVTGGASGMLLYATPTKVATYAPVALDLQNKWKYLNVDPNGNLLTIAVGAFVPRGTYNSGTTYAKNDLVTYSNQTYVSIQDANTGNQPDISPTWWESLYFVNTAANYHWTGTNLFDTLDSNGGDLTQQSLTITQPTAPTSQRSHEFYELTTGEFRWDVVNGDTSVNHRNWTYLPWFTFPYQYAGWLDVGVPVTFFQQVGGIVSLGRQNNYPLIDPNSCSLTHTGSGGTGQYYSISLLDSNSGTSRFTPLCHDASAFVTPDASHTNTVCWLQPGGYSNTIVSRGTDNTMVLSDAGSGVISLIPSGLQSTPECFTDDGSLPVVTLASLEGQFYNVPARNTTGSFIGTGRLWNQGSQNFAGGTNNAGSFYTQQLPDPPAPAVAVNSGSGTTYYYKTIYKDYLGSATSPSPSSTVSGGATPNNTGSWNCYPFYTSVDFVVSTDNTNWYYMTGSLGLPCEGTNYPNGIATDASFTDTGQTRTAYVLPSRNALGDMFADGNITANPLKDGTVRAKYFIADGGNVTTPLTFYTDSIAGHGYVSGNSGDLTHTGYLDFFEPSGTLSFTLGFDTTADLSVTPLDGGSFNIAGPLKIGGVAGFSGTKTAGSCTFTISQGIITNVTGC